MKILSISTRNFRLHAESDVTIPPEGVTGIVGTNESGKSTLLEAAVWALYGGDTTRGTKAGLRWHRAPARRKAGVTLRFELAGRVYRIERDETSATLFDEAAGRKLAEGVTPVNRQVPRLLGMSYAEFSASYLCSQKDLARIATMLPTERVAFVRQVMGVGQIDVGLKACRKAKAALADERRGLEVGLGERGPLEEAVEYAGGELRRLQEERRAREEERRVAAASHQAAGAELDVSRARKAEHERHTRERGDAANARDAAALEVTRLEERIQRQQTAAARLREVGDDLGALPGLREERDRLVAARGAAGERKTLEGRIAAIADEIDGPAGLRERIAAAEAQAGHFDAAKLEEAEGRVRDAEALLEKLRGDRLGLRARSLAAADAAEKEAVRHGRRIAAIQEAGAGGACPTCARALGGAFATVVQDLERERQRCLHGAEDARIDAEEFSRETDEEIEAAIARDAARKDVERWTQVRRDGELGARQAREWGTLLDQRVAERDQLERRLEALPRVAPNPERLREVEAELQRLTALDESLRADRALADQLEETEELLAERLEMQAAAEQAIGDAEAAIRELAFDDKVHARLQEQAEGARQAAEDARVALARAQEAERGASAALDAARRALAEYDRRAGRLREVLAEHHAHERADARLSEFRVAVASTIRPELEELMSGFVHLLTDGRHEAVTLGEDFGATLHASGVPEEVVSGGTEDIAALAMRLAISQMIAERAGHPLSLLILDEPFGSLDETRRGNVLALIRRLRTVFQQVLVISHVAETRDAVDHVIELEFDEAAGMTRVLGGGAPAAGLVA